jgi:prevent-host-death family protein
MWHMDRIGVRELRQHASRYLQRVAHGEIIEVTDRGRPVARLVPVITDPWADMVASGRVTPAEDDTYIADESPGDYDVEASNVLAAMRAEEP